MIRKFTVENFYSIRDKVALNFSIPKNAPPLEAFYKTCDEGRYPKVVAVFGHNASGKTNLVKALAFLKYFTTDSYLLDKDQDIPVFGYKFCEETKDATSKFELEFDAYGEIYLYTLEVKSEGIVRESLKTRLKKATIFTRIGKTIKSPIKEIAKLSDIFSVKVSLLSFCYHNDIEIAALNSPINAFLNSVSNVTSMGRDNLTSPLLDKIFSSTEKYKLNEDIKDQAVQLLSSFDLGLVDIQFKTKEVIKGDKAVVETIPFVFHEINGDRKSLFIGQESNGTQSLYVLIFDVLNTLKHGGVAVIDEIDAYLHSHMLKNFLELFYDEESNPHGAQLIFTGHADYIMSYLEKEQIILTEKDENCVTDAYFIKDIKGVRRVDNLREKYHAGAYGGIPVEA